MGRGGRPRDRGRKPGREDVIAEVRAASTIQLDQAVSAARSALHGDWARMSGRDRGVVLARVADLLDARADLIGEVMTLDNGSPLPVVDDGRAPPRRRAVPLLCGLGDQDCWRELSAQPDRAARPRFPGRDRARTGRRDRRDRTVERTAGDDRAQDGAGARCRLHDGHQDRRAGAAGRRTDRADLGRRGRTGGGLQPGPRPWRGHRRSAGGAPPGRQDRLHRLDRGGPQDRRGSDR